VTPASSAECPAFRKAIRGHMAELGIISAKDRNGTAELLQLLAQCDGE
jgi:hypothetical protein